MILLSQESDLRQASQFISNRNVDPIRYKDLHDPATPEVRSEVDQ